MPDRTEVGCKSPYAFLNPRYANPRYAETKARATLALRGRRTLLRAKLLVAGGRGCIRNSFEFDFDAALGNDVETRYVGREYRLVGCHADLEPDRLGANGARLSNDLQSVDLVSTDRHEIGRPPHPRVCAQGRIRLDAVDGRDGGVDGSDVDVRPRTQIAENVVARSGRLRRNADDGHAYRTREQLVLLRRRQENHELSKRACAPSLAAPGGVWRIAKTTFMSIHSSIPCGASSRRSRFRGSLCRPGRKRAAISYRLQVICVTGRSCSAPSINTSTFSLRNATRPAIGRSWRVGNAYDHATSASVLAPASTDQ